MDTHKAAIPESIITKARLWSLNQWASECQLLTPEQLTSLLPLVKPQANDPNWKDKLQQLFMQYPLTKSNLEFGKELDAIQILAILHFVKNENKVAANLEKLSSLFIGITPSVFTQILQEASQEELTFLREEAITESIQHNLTMIVTELQNRFAAFCSKLTLKENEIETIDLKEMGTEDITGVHRSMNSFQIEGNDILTLASRALTIAWNTSRLDLIQQLGKIKEFCQKCLIDRIGKIGNKETSSTGLFLLLEKRGDLFYSDTDTNGRINLMQNTSPALEALVKLSVWYIQDYREVGLLPPLKPALEANENVNLKEREQLFLTAEKNLNHLGLKTLLDIKSARIYSKKALMDFINTSKNKF